MAPFSSWHYFLDGTIFLMALFSGGIVLWRLRASTFRRYVPRKDSMYCTVLYAKDYAKLSAREYMVWGD
jgi:hypothetical protein